MTLIRELWLAIIVMLVVAFGGTFVTSTAAARRYSAEQLYVKNVDNATALALSMSQLDKDPVTLELLLTAQFDAGHYRLIRLADPNGKVLVERRDDNPIVDVPAAFIAAVAVQVEPGVAQVQDGWKQFGTLTLESHDRYIYAELWNGALRLLGWFAVTAVLVGALGSVLLRRILRPLKGVVEQAEAIGERRFVTQAEPVTAEFRQLVRSMNRLSNRVKQLLEVESQRIEQLRLEAQTDPLTGLRNRETFIASLDDALMREDLAESGLLLILRMTGLTQLNLGIGRQAADQHLRLIGENLARVAARQPGAWIVARLNAADFAVMAAGVAGHQAFAEELLADMQVPPLPADASTGVALRVGCTTFHRGESRAAVLTRADGALAEAELYGASAAYADARSSDPTTPSDLMGWRTLLEDAMRRDGVQLGHFPVATRNGDTLHHEAPVRLRIGDEWQPAARFIAWASRLGLMTRIDAQVIDAAFEQLARRPAAISINVSPESIGDPAFVGQLVRRAQQAPGLAAMLWLDVSEYGALMHFPEFRRFCERLKPLGYKLGLKHAGHQIARIAELHDLGVDYLKVDGSIINGIDESAGHQAFLRSLCAVAHTIGMTTIASGVSKPEHVELLGRLGIDGYTGIAIKS
jgi:EAL domain-containing protein (putative c-di-GMP-specific phosphodiesterase class I)/GGDEF domain-containing protein